jgi:hypothetical protein
VAGRFDLGRKVFFLHPPSVIQKEMIQQIIAAEYEVYILYDHVKARRVLAVHNDSILFINIDSGMPEPKWELYVTELMQTEETRGVGIGIITYNQNRELAEKYLMELSVPCGYIKLSLGVRQSVETLLRTLEANEAKGRRKFVRARCDRSQASFNVKVRGQLKTGVIRDISSAGMACTFDQPQTLKLRDVLPDMQLRLRAAPCPVSGVIAGIRDGDPPEYVVMFPQSMPRDTRDKIRRFVFTVLQEELDRI